MSPARVPLFDLSMQHRELQEAIETAVARVLASGQVILGPDCSRPASIARSVAQSP